MKLERFRDRFFEGTPRYRWLDTLGRGGMGVVFKAHDNDLDEEVAIKVLSPDLEVDDQELLLRFKREINLNRKIKHPNVARIHDFGTSGDYPFITMEYVPGRNLRRLIQDEGRLAPAVAVAILRQIALGTQAAHKLGIIHRDLKSPNVVVDDSGAVAILDFGLARGLRSENVTLDSVLIGTPHYMSPEQALGRPTDVRSDLYSIGVIGFECLTGHVPFTGEAPLAIAMKHVNETVPDELAGYEEIPEKLRAIVMKALEKSPADRYQTAADLESELGQLALPVPESFPVTPLPGPAKSTTSYAPEAYRTIQFAAEAGPASSLRPRGTPTPPPAPAPEKEAPHEELVGNRTLPASGGLSLSVKTRKPVILVAEDDAVERKMISSVVREYACETREARSGQEVLESILKEPPDLVLMDVKLPDMDGFDVTRIIKSQKASAALPVVLLSSRLDRNRYAFGIQSGASDLLGKPIVMEQMIARVWNVLQHRGFIPPEGNEALNAALKATLPDKTPSMHS